MLAFSFGHRDLPREHASQLSSGSVRVVILSRTEARLTPTYPTWRGLELGSVTLTPDATGGVFEVASITNSSGRAGSRAAFRKSGSSSSSCATASRPVARSDIPTPANAIQPEP